jgi:hypothetical protein
MAASAFKEGGSQSVRKPAIAFNVRDECFGTSTIVRHIDHSLYELSRSSTQGHVATKFRLVSPTNPSL